MAMCVICAVIEEQRQPTTLFLARMVVMTRWTIFVLLICHATHRVETCRSMNGR
nr:MAG TPA: hypothetical protein [Caudoviricetes sp.]